MEIKDIQSFLQQENQDAWILVDYENHNPAVVSLLGEKMLTRKIFMVIPSKGKPYLIAHQIDTVYLKDDATLSRFELRVYHTWKEMLTLAKDSFSDYRNVLMDISENGLLPRVSLADYGSVAFVKDLGINVSSSANLFQTNTSVLSQKSMQLQDEACKSRKRRSAFLPPRFRKTVKRMNLKYRNSLLLASIRKAFSMTNHHWSR